MTYERVRYQPEGERARTIHLRDVVETTIVGAPAIGGIEVDREGDDVHGKDFDERRHIIETALIRKRTPLVMDKHTAMLVEPGQTFEETSD